MRRHVLFDLDGTLTDSAPGITRCLAHAVEAAGRIAPALGVLRPHIGSPLREIFRDVLGTDDAERIEVAIAAYTERFDRAGIHENSIFPGVVEALEALSRAGCRLYVATAKTQDVAERVIENFELTRHFDGIFGVRRAEGILSKEDVVRSVLERCAIAHGEAVLVGDRCHDVEAALAVGIGAIGVAWGYGPAHELRGAHAVADLPDLLPKLVRALD